MTLFRSLLILERRVATLCKNGRIAGAKKQGNRWLIPADTQKPADQRLKTGAFRKTERAPKLPLPIGVSNYCLASSESELSNLTIKSTRWMKRNLRL